MFRLVKDGEFESPQEAAWLFCAGELPIDRARELADHWIEQGMETEALIRFLVDCQDEKGHPAWREQRSSFERALESLGATLWSKDQALIRIAVRQNERYLAGALDRNSYIVLLDWYWLYAFQNNGDVEEFGQASGLFKLWDSALEYCDLLCQDSYLRHDLEPLMDEQAKTAAERIEAMDFQF